MARKPRYTHKQRKRRLIGGNESDGQYLLKLVLIALLATVWIKFKHPLVWGSLPLGGVPVGFLVGLLIVHEFEHFQLDRKIWYAILVVTAIVSYILPSGIML